MGDAPAVLTILLSVAGGWALLTGDAAKDEAHQPPTAFVQSANGAGNAAAGPVSLVQGPDGYFYADALVNGAPVRFLVDTGANTTVLLRKDAQRARLPVLAEVRLRTAGHAIQANRSRIDTLDMGGSRVVDLPAVIVDDAGGVGTSLIGTNALARLGPVRLHGSSLTVE